MCLCRKTCTYCKFHRISQVTFICGRLRFPPLDQPQPSHSPTSRHGPDKKMDLGAGFLAKVEPFLLMSKSAKGAAAAKLILDATGSPGVFVFGELLDVPSIQEVRGFSSKLGLSNRVVCTVIAKRPVWWSLPPPTTLRVWDIRRLPQWVEPLSSQYFTYRSCMQERRRPSPH